ncbi:MAG TPA: CPBP family intramembrane glutamic endopeptidase [Candidatus Sulfotelmatobacter sp.]|nr:CPBP family intramembrane glutamic endopeptidase [Candidatus Sulfotelmatobacter sp.]
MRLLAAGVVSRLDIARIALLLTGMAAAVVLRTVVASGRPAASYPGAVAFCALLLALSLASGWRPQRLAARACARHVAVGLGGGAVLCISQLFHARLLAAVEAPSRLLVWSALVALVAVCEEIFFRGALFDVFTGRPWMATVCTAAAFAAAHVPLYGWAALPLDAAAGVWLGALRLLSGGVLAPAVAHTLADWATGWLHS